MLASCNLQYCWIYVCVCVKRQTASPETPLVHSWITSSSCVERLEFEHCYMTGNCSCYIYVACFTGFYRTVLCKRDRQKRFCPSVHLSTFWKCTFMTPISLRGTLSLAKISDQKHRFWQISIPFWLTQLFRFPCITVMVQICLCYCQV